MVSGSSEQHLVFLLVLVLLLEQHLVLLLVLLLVFLNRRTPVLPSWTTPGLLEQHLVSCSSSGSSEQHLVLLPVSCSWSLIEQKNTLLVVSCYLSVVFLFVFLKQKVVFFSACSWNKPFLKQINKSFVFMKQKLLILLFEQHRFFSFLVSCFSSTCPSWNKQTKSCQPNSHNSHNSHNWQLTTNN